MSSSADRAYAAIKAQLLAGAYDAGARLPEDMIASELGLSRTPIRDALRRLQVEGLVTITPNSGARVAHWTADALEEISQMRAMLEGYAAELAARKVTAEGLARLDRHCEDMAGEIARAPAPDLARLSRINLDFHREIAAAADNSRLLASIEPLWSFSLIRRKFGFFDRSRLGRSLAHHVEIVAALRDRDSDWARAIMQTHIHAARALDATIVASDAPRAAMTG